MSYKELKKLLWDTFGDYPVDKLLMAVIWGEGRGEPFIGKVAIANVILNRAKRKTSTPLNRAIKEVILAPYQFSSFLPDDPNFEKIKSILDKDIKVSLQKNTMFECYVAGYLAYHRLMDDPTLGATHYYADYIEPPSWAKDMQVTALIGHHIFLKEGRNA